MNIFEGLKHPEPIRYRITKSRRLSEKEKASVKSCIFAARKMGCAWQHVAEFTLHNGKVLKITASITPVEPYYTKESESVYRLNEVALDLDSIMLDTLTNEKDENDWYYRIRLD